MSGALLVVVTLVVIFVVWVGLRLVEAIIGPTGPATECWDEIVAKQAEYAGQGMSRCDAYVKAIGGAKSPPCPAGGYAQFLRNLGC